MDRSEAAVHWSAPGAVEFHKIHPAGATAHVPEIRLALLEACVGPGKPNAVVMRVLQWKIIRHQLPFRRKHRMQITAAPIQRADAFAR